MDAPTITTIGPWPATLRSPGVVAAYSIADYAGRSGLDLGATMALRAAALRLCWPQGTTWPAMPPPRPLTVGDPLLAWGGAVLEGLLGAGVAPAAISEAGQVAISFAINTLPSAQGVERAKGNSEAPAAAG